MLLGHPSGDDIGVVAIRNGGKGVGLPYPRLLEDVTVEDEPDDLLSFEVLAEAFECFCVLVDNRHRMAQLLEASGKLRADPSTACDDHMH